MSCKKHLAQKRSIWTIVAFNDTSSVIARLFQPYVAYNAGRRIPDRAINALFVAFRALRTIFIIPD